MRRTIAGVAAAALALGTSSVVAAAETEPPWSAGRVEVLSEGVALTIPDGWIGLNLRGDVPAQLEAAGLTMDLPADLDGELLLTTAGGSCIFDLVDATAVDLHDPELVAQLDAVIRSEPAVTGYEGHVRLDLPGGAAILYAYGLPHPSDPGTVFERRQFWIADDPYSLILTCDGDDAVAAAADGVARSFAWLDPIDTAGLGGRLEVPAADVALTFPDDWVVLDLERAGIDEHLALVARTHPRWVETVGMQLEGLGPLRDQGFSFHATVLSPATPEGWPVSTCLVQSTDSPLGTSYPEMIDRSLEYIGSDPLLVDTPEVNDLALEVGESLRIDHLTRSKSGRETWNSLFLLDLRASLREDRSELQMGCLSFDERLPEWTEIAESAERLSLD